MEACNTLVPSMQRFMVNYSNSAVGGFDWEGIVYCEIKVDFLNKITRARDMMVDAKEKLSLKYIVMEDPGSIINVLDRNASCSLLEWPKYMWPRMQGDLKKCDSAEFHVGEFYLYLHFCYVDKGQEMTGYAAPIALNELLTNSPSNSRLEPLNIPFY